MVSKGHLDDIYIEIQREKGEELASKGNGISGDIPGTVVGDGDS